MQSLDSHRLDLEFLSTLALEIPWLPTWFIPPCSSLTHKPYTTLLWHMPTRCKNLSKTFKRRDRKTKGICTRFSQDHKIPFPSPQGTHDSCNSLGQNIQSTCWFCSVAVSDSLWLYGLQHTRLLCLPLSPRVCLNSRPLSWWCHPAISSSVVPFSSCPQSLPACSPKINMLKS